MPFDKRTLVYPAETQFGERVVVAKGDVIVADGAEVEFGFETPGRVFLGERVALAGGIAAGGDVRVDLFSRIAGDVATSASAYLGERAVISGKLRVEGDLDVGDDVKIEQGFEAHGWINIRSPVPLVTYVFLYLLQLIQLGRSEEVERILAELEEGEQTFAVGEGFLFIPEGSRVGLTDSEIKGNLEIGAGARLLGNHEVDGWASLGRMAKLHGALRAGGKVTLEDFSEVHGDLVARGPLVIGDGCHVLGRVEAESVEMRQTARVEGAIVAWNGMRFVTPEVVAMKEKVESFENAKTPEVSDLLG